MEQKTNLKTISVILETLLDSNLHVWMKKSEDGTLSFPPLGKRSSFKESLGFDVLSVPSKSTVIIQECGSITKYQAFVRSTKVFSDKGLVKIPVSEAWQYFRGVGSFREAEVLDDLCSSFRKAGIKTGIDSVIPLSEGKTLLVEREMTTMSKVLLFIVGAWLVGKYFKLKVRGSQKQISTLASAMLSSKRFQDELKRPGASLENVMNKLKVKNMDADRFQKTFGIKWPV
jgi:hypothetical protein